MTIMATRKTNVKVLAIATLVILLNYQVMPLKAEEPEYDPIKIVEAADRIRFPGDGFQVDVNITSIGGTSDGETRKYRVLSKGNSNTVVMVTDPPSERGQIILMKDSDLWIFMPEVSQPVRVSLAQRLTGQVANGDLARANFGGDYTPKILKTEEIEGHSYFVMELIANTKSVTYQKVVYWVRKKDNWPYKAEFYSLSNRLLKTCYYEQFEKMEGQTRPTRLVMEDALKQGTKSILTYSSMKRKELPEKIFTKDYLKKIN